MAPDERIRAAIQEKLVALIGAEEAAAPMEMLPPERWTELATKRDLEALRLATKADIDGLRTEVKADIDGLRTEVKADIASAVGHLEQRTDMLLEIVEMRLRADIADVRAQVHDLRGDVVAQIAETRVTLSDQLRDTYLKLVATLVPSMLVGVGLAFSAAKFS